MKVGTDGVLFGAWISAQGAQSILDIGTGTGLIALMLAQRCNASIDAVEIDADAALQSEDNVKNSPWKDRVSVYNMPFQSFSILKKKYDLIVSNPPYFENAKQAHLKNRTIARHDMLLNRKELINGIVRVSHADSRFAVILPTEGFEEFCSMTKQKGLILNKKTLVRPVPQYPPKRVLAEYSFRGNRFRTNELIIEKHGRHQYSDEYINLTKDFYIKMD